MVLGFWRRWDSAKLLAQAETLAVAAATAYAIARKEKLPLAYIAQRDSLGAPFWFADSLLRQEAVFGRISGNARHERLTRDMVNDLTLSPDMVSLKRESSVEPQFVDLRVTTSDLRRYMRWARTVQ